jgi:hypothetical protein
MSVWASSWAWEQDAPSPEARLVLLALAEFADERGMCRSKAVVIARMTGCVGAALDRALAELAAARLIRAVLVVDAWGRTVGDGWLLAPETASRHGEGLTGDLFGVTVAAAAAN